MNEIANENIMETIEEVPVFEILDRLGPLMIQNGKSKIFEKIKYFFEYGEFRIGMIYVYKFLNEYPKFIDDSLEHELEEFYSEYVL